jgi:hypothetical protein
MGQATERESRVSERLRRATERAKEKAEASTRARSSEPGNDATDTETPARDTTNQIVVESLPPEYTEDTKRGKKTRKAKAAPQTTPPVPIPSGQARDMLLFMFNNMAAMMIGEYARLTDTEYRAIADPLERMMARLPAEASEKFGEYADPIMLVMGFGMWGVRVFYQIPRAVKAEREKAAMREMEKSISRDINLDPTKPANTPPVKNDVAMPKPHEYPAGIVTPPNGSSEAQEIPTGINPDMQQLWEQNLDG